MLKRIIADIIKGIAAIGGFTIINHYTGNLILAFTVLLFIAMTISTGEQNDE